jgi:hypothetical protein
MFAIPIDDARVGREAGDHELGPLPLGEPLYLVVVDQTVVAAHTVLHGAKELAGEVDLRPVREVATVIEAHAQNRVPGLH